MEAIVPKSNYVLSGQYERDCRKYKGPMRPEMELPGWLDPKKRKKLEKEVEKYS